MMMENNKNLIGLTCDGIWPQKETHKEQIMTAKRKKNRMIEVGLR